MTYSRNSSLTQRGVATGAQIQAWLETRAPAGAAFVKLPQVPIPAGLGDAIYEESNAYGLNQDLIAAQVSHESAAAQSRIARDKNNYSGYGAENDDPYGKAHTFATPREGIRVQVAHLMGYIAGDGPWNALSPRYSIVKQRGWAGTVQTIGQLEQKWAWTPQAHYDATPVEQRYGSRVAAIANTLLAFVAANPEPPKEEPPVSDAQIPGFKWHPADRNHYQPGRTATVRGGAQHYTAGTNSLAWLSTTPGTQVSAHFLVKNNPTLEDRGWQIVRMEDTAWTTAFANPYTVSIEYEHTGKGPVPDIAYTVLAHTWRDIAAYVKRNNLGSISADASGLKGHREWVGNPGLICPDGIDVARVIRDWKALITEVESLVIAGNPYDARLVLGFRSTFLKVGAALYPDDPIAGGLSVFGYPMGDEQPASFGSFQVFERVVLKWNRGTPAPFDIVVAFRNEEIPEAA